MKTQDINNKAVINKPLIICVDDEQIILDSLNRQLQRKFGDLYEYEFAESAEEALEMIDEMANAGHTPTVIISDQMMPGMTGDQFLTHVHKRYPKPIKILLTGQASLESAINVINNANLYRYLTKPWNEEDLLLTVEKGLQQYQLLEDTHKQNEVFSRFVPHQFLECLDKKSLLDIKLGDHVKREMSILFSDIRNFTALSEKMTPEENYNFINNYLSYLEPAIQSNNGFIDKFMGDGVMALFYQPFDALKAAIGIQKAIKAFNHDYQAAKFHPIASGIGLHTGSLMLGIVGVEGRLQGTVISDAVNLAARLEELTAIYDVHIVASEEFLAGLGHELPTLPCRPLGKVTMKGKQKEVSIYEIIEVANDPSCQQKLLTKENFSQGLQNFFDKKFAEACMHFKTVLDQNPEDQAARFYLTRAANYMVHGTPAGWHGVEIINRANKE